LNGKVNKKLIDLLWIALGGTILRKLRHRSNPEKAKSMSFEKCFKCGAILPSIKLHDSKYCENCAKEIKEAQDKGHLRCIVCSEYFPPSELYDSKYCKECKKELITCRECGKKFIPEKSYYHTCPVCHFPEKPPESNQWERLPNGGIIESPNFSNLPEMNPPKKCRECEKEFIPEKSYYHTCTACIKHL